MGCGCCECGYPGQLCRGRNSFPALEAVRANLTLSALRFLILRAAFYIPRCSAKGRLRNLPFDIRTDTRYGRMMLKTFRHKGLKRLFEKDDPSGVRTDQVRRIMDVLANLDQARQPTDLALPGYKLHAMRGELKGHWAVTISGNWRIVFRFDDGDAFDVDLVDYH